MACSWFFTNARFPEKSIFLHRWYLILNFLRQIWFSRSKCLWHGSSGLLAVWLITQITEFKQKLFFSPCRRFNISSMTSYVGFRQRWHHWRTFYSIPIKMRSRLISIKWMNRGLWEGCMGLSFSSCLSDLHLQSGNSLSNVSQIQQWLLCLDCQNRVGQSKQIVIESKGKKMWKRNEYWELSTQRCSR